MVTRTGPRTGESDSDDPDLMPEFTYYYMCITCDPSTCNKTSCCISPNLLYW